MNIILTFIDCDDTIFNMVNFKANTIVLDFILIRHYTIP